MHILTNINMHGNQILNVSIQNLAQAPSEKVVGQVYFNTQEKRMYCWTGDAWLPLDAKDARPSATSMVKTINEGSSLIKQDKIDGLSAKLSGANLVQAINAGVKTINTDKITGLDTALANKETPQGAKAKANTALQQAKEYAKSEITKVVGGASEAYDTLKEIEDELKKNDSLDKTINQALKNKTGKFSQDVGNAVDTSIVVKHNLKTQDLVVTLREKASPFKIVYADVEITDENTVTLKFAKAPALNEYRVIVIG